MATIDVKPPEEDLDYCRRYCVQWHDGLRRTRERFFHSYAQAERFASQNEAQSFGEALQDLDESAGMEFA